MESKNGISILEAVDKLNNVKPKEDDIEWDDDWDSEDSFVEDKALTKELTLFLQELIDDNAHMNEEFTSEPSLTSHFESHCLGNGLKKDGTPKISNHNTVYYDFIKESKYAKHEDEINKYVREVLASTANKTNISTLKDTIRVQNAFRELFKGNRTVVFDGCCGLVNNTNGVILGIHAFCSEYTTNYEDGNTVDVIVMSLAHKTITLYPVDSYYLETKLNNILSKPHNPNIQVKFNH